MKAALALALPLVLAGCIQSTVDTIGNVRGTQQLPPATTIGPQPSDLKESPCACIEIELGSRPRAA